MLHIASPFFFCLQPVQSDAHTVHLTDISREHSGTYKCEVSADAPLFHTDIKSDHMLVVDVVPADGVPQVEAHSPDTSSSSRVHLQEQYLTCRGPPASIRPNITWYINEQMVSYNIIIPLLCYAFIFLYMGCKKVREEISNSNRII